MVGISLLSLDARPRPDRFLLVFAPQNLSVLSSTKPMLQQKFHFSLCSPSDGADARRQSESKHHRTYSTRPSRSGTAPNSAGVRYEALASRPLKATFYHSLNHTDEGSFWCPRQGHGVISGHRPCSLKRRDVLHRLTAWMELKTTRCTEKRRAGERAGRKRTKLLS